MKICHVFRARGSLVLLLALGWVQLSVQAQDWQVHCQSTVVTQAHGAFNSPYQGAHSLLPVPERATSFTATLMTGFRPWAGTELYLDLEGAAGKGVSSVLGLAGAANGETYRVGNPAFTLSLARLLLRQTWDLGGEAQKVEDDAHQLGGTRSSRRLVVHAGRFSVMDVFDNSAYAHDPRSQFLNWTLMGHGAWDYPADTRGYTWGLATELYWDAWALRGGHFAEPREANQMALDHDMARAHGDALELSHDHAFGALPGTVRLLAYRNVADMGDYRQALAAPAPDVVATRAQGRVKRGWGLGADQALGAELGGFLRCSWDDGATESWAFTEVDRSLSAGLNLKGGRWGRPGDQVAVAGVQNGLAAAHRQYLAAGGLGFLLGDGRLNYAPERVLEAYYALALGRAVTLSLDLQRAWNPGYNADQGPVFLAALRCHAQF